MRLTLEEVRLLYCACDVFISTQKHLKANYKNIQIDDSVIHSTEMLKHKLEEEYKRIVKNGKYKK